MKVQWPVLKKFVDDRYLSVQFVDIDGYYWLKAFDGLFVLECELRNDTSNLTSEEEGWLADFETSYKSQGNRSLEVRAADGRVVTRADSRPRGCTTNFISRGDSLTGLGDGKVIAWDFANDEDIVTDNLTTSVPDGFKRKRIQIGFSEKIYMKEGTLYFHNSPKGCFVDVYVICKAGSVYQDKNGSIPSHLLGLPPGAMFTQATQDTPINHCVNHHHIQGDCPMGDELNTEGASESSLPTQQQGYEIWIEITTPQSDVVSNGSLELEIYRPRTVLLPGENL